MIVLIGLFALGMVALLVDSDTAPKKEPVPLVDEADQSEKPALEAPQWKI